MFTAFELSIIRSWLWKKPTQTKCFLHVLKYNLFDTTLFGWAQKGWTLKVDCIRPGVTVYKSFPNKNKKHSKCNFTQSTYNFFAPSLRGPFLAALLASISFCLANLFSSRSCFRFSRPDVSDPPAEVPPSQSFHVSWKCQQKT